MKYLQISGLLAIEAFLKPSWAFYHLLGFIDQRCLIKFHQKCRTKLNQYFRSLDDVISLVGNIDRNTVHKKMECISIFNARYESDLSGTGISVQNDASRELQLLVFLLTSFLQPEAVVEVGVGRGATTRSILQALKENGKGHLYSIEFPALRPHYTKDVGGLVPVELRDRWTLILGPSQHHLPLLLQKLERVSLFVHDGAHSYHIQRQDYLCAIHHLALGGVLVSDDINNDSFLQVTEENKMIPFLVKQTKGDPIGVSVKPGGKVKLS
jgi:predicted O-methyltransferase YrrM